MSAAIRPSSATSNKQRLRSFTDVSLKPLLQFITTECISSMSLSASGPNVVDFVLHLLAANKDQLYRICGCSIKVGSHLPVHNSFADSVKHTPSLPASSATQSHVSQATRILELEAQVRDLQALVSLQSAHAPPRSLPSETTVRVDLFLTDEVPAPSTQRLPLVDFDRALSLALRRTDAAFMREVFDRHADNGELSPAQLMAALQEVNAPALSCEESPADTLFRRADANLSGSLDFSEYISLNPKPTHFMLKTV
jgi:hypothetical protein